MVGSFYLVAVLVALLIVVSFLLIFLIAWLLGAKKDTEGTIERIHETNELYKESVKQSREGLELQNEANRLMQELIDTLGSNRPS